MWACQQPTLFKEANGLFIDLQGVERYQRSVASDRSVKGREALDFEVSPPQVLIPVVFRLEGSLLRYAEVFSLLRS